MLEFAEPDRESRITRYYQAEHPADLARWLVDAEDRIGELESRYAPTTEEYQSLLKDSDRLARLEAAGVDNWEGYSQAVTEDNEW